MWRQLYQTWSCASEPIKLVFVVIKMSLPIRCRRGQIICHAELEVGQVLTDRWDHFDKTKLDTNFLFILFSLVYKFPQNVSLDRKFSSYHHVVIFWCIFISKHYKWSFYVCDLKLEIVRLNYLINITIILIGFVSMFKTAGLSTNSVEITNYEKKRHGYSCSLEYLARLLYCTKV